MKMNKNAENQNITGTKYVKKYEQTLVFIKLLIYLMIK